MFDFIKGIINSQSKMQQSTENNESAEYLSCKHLHGGITFMHKAFRTCCSNNLGVTFVDDYKGEEINWKKIAKIRSKVIENCKKGILPENCKGCVDLEYKNWEEHKLIDNIYINHWDHCNCGCVYCVAGQSQFLVSETRPSRYYRLFEHIQELYNNNMISKDVHVEMVGGDLTVLDEADDIINLCLDNGVGEMAFHSSCIFYSKGIERALKEAPSVSLDFSLDSADRLLYKKIKRIDAFDKVVDNIKRYMSCSEKAKEALIAKYIIVDGLNDSVEEIDKWLKLIHSLGIKMAKVDVNFRKYFPEFGHSNPTVPQHYYDMMEHYKKTIDEFGIQDRCWEFTKRVLKEGGIPKNS